MKHEIEQGGATKEGVANFKELTYPFILNCQVCSGMGTEHKAEHFHLVGSQ